MGFITLLHGKNFNGAYWEETANFLHEKGFGILIPDQIGFGKSLSQSIISTLLKCWHTILSAY